MGGPGVGLALTAAAEGAAAPLPSKLARGGRLAPAAGGGAGCAVGNGVGAGEGVAGGAGAGPVGGGNGLSPALTRRSTGLLPPAALAVLMGGGGDGGRGWIAATTMAAMVAPGCICGSVCAVAVGAGAVLVWLVAGMLTGGAGACACGGAMAVARGGVPGTCGGMRRVTARSVGRGVGVSTVTSPAAVRMVAFPSSCATTCPDTTSARSSPASFSGKARIMTSASGTRPGPAGAGPVGAVMPVRPGGTGADMGVAPSARSAGRQLLCQRHDVMRRVGGGGTDQQRRLRLDAFAHLHVAADDAGQLRTLS